MKSWKFLLLGMIVIIMNMINHHGSKLERFSTIQKNQGICEAGRKEKT